MKINRVHIGEIIRQKVKEKDITKSSFAQSLNIQRQNIEKTVFAKNSLDSDLLCRISEVLDCNLFDYFQSDELCNKKYYTKSEEIKATLSIEIGAERQDKVFRFVFGENKIEILDKE